MGSANPALGRRTLAQRGLLAIIRSVRLRGSNNPGLLALLLILAAAGCSQRTPPTDAEFELQRGDLLFQDLDGGKLSDAIETVTEGYHGARLSHVGMVVSTRPGGVQVIEASGPGVRVTSLDRFLARSHDATGRPKVLVGRLKPPYRPLIPTAVAFAMDQRGKPYDRFFKMDGQAYYCSELIHDAFRHANHGRPLFATTPMTFKDPATGEFFPAWTEYFAKLGASVPEGDPGVNPGAMSRADCLDIVHAFGEPSRR